MDLEWNWRDRCNILGKNYPLGRSSTDKGASNRESDLLQFSEAASSLFEDSKKDQIRSKINKLFTEMKPQSEPVFGKTLEEKELERQRKVKEKFGNMLDDSMVFSMKKTKVQVFSLMKMEQFGDGQPKTEDILEAGDGECEESTVHKAGDAKPMRGMGHQGDKEFAFEKSKQPDSVHERKLNSPSDPIPTDSKPNIMEIIKDHEHLMKMASSIIKSNAVDFPMERSYSENVQTVTHSRETMELEVKTPSSFLAEVQEVEEVRVEDIFRNREKCQDSKVLPSADKEPQVKEPVTKEETQPSIDGAELDAADVDGTELDEEELDGEELGVAEPDREELDVAEADGEELDVAELREEAAEHLDSQSKSLNAELEDTLNESSKSDAGKEKLKPEDLEDCLDEDMYDKIIAWLESNEVVQKEDVYSSETPKIDAYSAEIENIDDETEKVDAKVNMEDDAETSFCPSGAGDNTNEGARESFCSYCEELHKIAEMSKKSMPSSETTGRKSSSKTKTETSEDPSFILTRKEPHEAHHLAPYLEHHGPDCKARPSFFCHLRKLYKKILGSEGKGNNKKFSLINRLYLCYPLSFCFTPENHSGSSYLSVKTSDISFEVEEKQDSFLKTCLPSLIMDGAHDTEEETKRNGSHVDAMAESCTGDSVLSYSRKSVPGITTV